ncbi:MAG: hypothetical protein IJX11_07170 [Bacteroidales bacterium]|nr:hypothetical protein [Bacteroidales bacterium]
MNGFLLVMENVRSIGSAGRKQGRPGSMCFCDGYRMFFRHVAPYMDRMKELLEARMPAAGVMPWAKARH